MPPVRDDPELLALAEETERVAAHMTDPSVRVRLLAMAQQVREMACASTADGGGAIEPQICCLPA